MIFHYKGPNPFDDDHERKQECMICVQVILMFGYDSDKEDGERILKLLFDNLCSFCEKNGTVLLHNMNTTFIT